MVLAVLVPSAAQAVDWGLWVDRGYGLRFEGRFERFEDCDSAARLQAQAQARAGCSEMAEEPAAPSPTRAAPAPVPEPLRPDQLPHYIYDINTGRLVSGPFKDSGPSRAYRSIHL